MSAPTETTQAVVRRDDDPQPNPKRRKNSASSKSRNGYNAQTDTARISTSTEQPSTDSKPIGGSGTDNGNGVSSTSLSSSTQTTSTVEATQMSVSGATSLNGAAKTVENASESEQATTTDQSHSALKRNQFGEISDGHMSPDDWLEQWRKGKTRFTMKVPNRMLVKHIDRLVEGKTSPSFFVPCCGKSLDIKWLSDRGYPVVGVEIAELACKQFFEEHELEYKIEDISGGPKGKLFKGVDRDIKLYACDFFSVTSDFLGVFDCIWDRGSYAAMNPDDRQRYCDVISKLLKQDGRYLLDCFELEHSVFAGPPHTTDPSDLDRLFASFKVEQLDHVDAMNDWTRSWGVEFFFQNDFLLTPSSENTS